MPDREQMTENPVLAAKKPLKVVLCSPRGFCAGVVRAIDSVERALALYGAPVYVRHEIVHNRYVVESLKAKGAIFVEELDEIPDTDAPVIFSAHGVPRSVPEQAERRNFFALDATCPLVTKVHREAEIHFRRGREIVLIGHAGPSRSGRHHGPVAGGAVTLVETLARSARFRAEGRGQARLCHADDAVGRRHRGNRRATLKRAVPGHRRAAQGRHLLRHHQPAGRGQARRAGGRGDDRGRRAEFVELAAPAGSGRARGLPSRGAGAARRRHRLGRSSARSPRSASRPARRRPKCWSRKSSTPSPRATTFEVETVSAADEDVFFPLPRPLRSTEAAE